MKPEDRLTEMPKRRQNSAQKRAEFSGKLGAPVRNNVSRDPMYVEYILSHLFG